MGQEGNSAQRGASTAVASSKRSAAAVTSDEETESRLRMWLLLSTVALMSVGILWWSSTVSNSDWADFSSAIGTGLLVAAVFATMQVYLTGEVQSVAYRKYLEKLMPEVTGSVRETIVRLNEDYLPTHEFPGSDLPDPKLNQLLDEDLARSTEYWFRGYSARYLAVRLRSGLAPGCQVRVVLPDPLVPSSLNLRLSYLAKRTSLSARDEQLIRGEILGDLKTGLTGLYLARHEVAAIEVILTSSPSLDRFETLRDAVWITLYSGGGERARFPRTLRFPAMSIMYKLQMSECSQLRDSPRVRRFEVTRNTDEAQFRGMLVKMLGSPVDDTTWRASVEQFCAFEETFSGQI
jgi:hypothetical protein